MRVRLWLPCFIGAFVLVSTSVMTTTVSGQVGLPLPQGQALGLSPGSPEIAVGHYYGHMFRGAYGSTVPYGWYSPWLRAPQTQKRKAHRAAVYATPRFGLQYNYPFAAGQYPQQGLELPVDPEQPLVPVQTDTYASRLGSVDVALELFKAGRYVEAGQVLSEELKQPQVSLDTYLAISELLVATGNYKDAARVLLHGLSLSDDLRALDAVNVANDFPTKKEFSKHLESIKGQAQGSRMHFLAAALELLSGESSGLDAMRALQENEAIGSAAKKIYLHFLGLRFQQPTEAPAAPSDDASKSSGEAPTEESL